MRHPDLRTVTVPISILTGASRPRAAQGVGQQLVAIADANTGGPSATRPGKPAGGGLLKPRGR